MGTMIKTFILLCFLIVIVSPCYVPFNQPSINTTYRTTTYKSIAKNRCDIWCRLKRIVLYIIQQLLSDDWMKELNWNIVFLDQPGYYSHSLNNHIYWNNILLAMKMCNFIYLLLKLIFLYLHFHFFSLHVK